MKELQIIIITISIFLFFSCQQESPNNVPYEITCDVETYNPNNTLATNTKIYSIKDAYLRTDEKSHSGKYSIKLNKEKQYGFSLTLKDVKPNEYFSIEVWRYGSQMGNIVARDKTSNVLYVQANHVVESSENGWDLIRSEFTIPPHLEDGEIKIFMWNSDTTNCYFDDLKIIRKPQIEYPEFNAEALNIYIDSFDIIKLNNKRLEAFNNGLLESTDDDWVNAVIFYEGEMIKAKMRLKGDWLDHLQDLKWSFRIKLGKNFSWKGMRTFSIQNPKTRYFTNEWMAHELFEKEDVLTTKYGFIPVYLNNKSLGYYAYEEHFEKQLLESRKRREGPILKYDESMFWERVKQFITTGDTIFIPLFEAANIIPFKINSTIENPVLFQQFKNGQNLMFNHKWFQSNINHTYDVESYAKYFALIDLTKGYHGLGWINRRFYYNPVIGKLEPIAFDCYTENGVFNSSGKIITGNFENNNYHYSEPGILSIRNLFNDTEFRDYYIFYLKKISNKNYLQEFFNSINNELEEYNRNIGIEYPFFTFDTAFVYNNAEKITERIVVYEERIKNEPDYSVIYDSLVDNKSKLDTTYVNTFPPLLVKAYSEKSLNDSLVIKIENYNALPIKILGTASQNRIIENYYNKYLIIEPYTTDSNWFTTIKTDIYSKYLFFTVDGIEDLFNIPIFNWPSPKNWSPQQELLENFAYQDNDSIKTLKNNLIVFKSRKYTISKPYIIPKGYKVRFDAGCKINIVDSALFISYSPVFMKGTKSNPIIIGSSDKTAKGFTVLQADEKSYLKDVIFNNLNTLDYKGWTLTGAVNFYESNVDINYTTFENNLCEDALNIIRSHFNVKFCSFDNIFADAFDSDFCTGNVYKTFFTNIANDAIDFSGSNIFIEECEIDKANDKGISGGENSNLTVINSKISNSNIGIASKDLSTIEVSGTVIDNCNFGVVAFRKKPEYGAAKISTHLLTITNIERKYLIEQNSVFIFNGDSIYGTEQNVARLFYSPEEN